jgi:branched-chain amino acid transport system ATP-binding protein
MTVPADTGHLQGLGLVKRFGGLAAVNDVTVETQPGTIAALIGPNGAGKTTLFQCLTGIETPDAGKVMLDGVDITKKNSDARARMGVGRTFQRLAIFESMTVADNLRVAAEHRGRTSHIRRIGSLLCGLVGITVGDSRSAERRVDDMLGLLGLGSVRDQTAGTLSTGTLRLVELGRALCHDPRVLLLDEPASGLDTIETQNLQQVLRQVVAGGIAVLLVEHDVDLVFHLADQVYAMAEGKVIAVGTPEQIRTSARVREAYLDVQPAES